MKRHRLFAAILGVAALVLGLLETPHSAIADIPVASNTVTLVNPGDAVRVSSLVGQSSCAFQQTGTVGPVDAYGSNDGFVTQTPLTITDYAIPPDVESQPFTPTTGISYIIAPTSFTAVEVQADVGTWSAGPAPTKLTCTASVARSGGGGGGGSVVGVEPLYSPAAGQLGFDYTFSGQFLATQFYGNGNQCALPFPGTGFTNTTDNDGFFLYADNADIFHVGTYGGKGCSSYVDALTMDASGNIYFPAVLAAYTPGCLFIAATTGQVESDGSGLTTCSGGGGGTTYTPGPNITFPPVGAGTPQPIELASVPQVDNIDFPATPFPAGAYAVFGTDGSKSNLVAAIVSPCPTTGCGIVAVTASGNCASSGGLAPNITCASPTPLPSPTSANGNCSWGGSFGLTLDCVTPSPAPSNYPTPAATASPPILVTTTTVGGGALFSFSLGVVPATLGGLGLNATTFANGQCPGWSTALSHFVASACSAGTTYTAGTNMSLASNVFSVVAAPNFAGSVTAQGNFITANNHAGDPATLNASYLSMQDNGNGQSIIGMVGRDGANFQGIYSYTPGGALELAMGNGVGLTGSGYFTAAASAWSLVNLGPTSACLQVGTGTGAVTPCSGAQLSLTTSGVTVDTLTDSALTASKSVCSNASKLLVSCGTAVGAQPIGGSCTITTGQSTCQTTATVVSGTTQCAVSLAGNPGIVSGTLPYASLYSLVGTTATIQLGYPVVTTGTTVNYSGVCS